MHASVFGVLARYGRGMAYDSDSETALPYTVPAVI
jgi:hypothetical protein